MADSERFLAAMAKAISFVDAMLPLSDYDRLVVFRRLTEAFCEHCGRKQDDGRRCQCNNDE